MKVCPITRERCWESCAWRVGEQCGVAAAAESLAAPVRQKEDVQFSVGAVARKCGVCRETVNNWIRGGKLKAAKVGREYRIAEKDLEAFLRKGEDNVRSD